MGENSQGSIERMKLSMDDGNDVDAGKHVVNCYHCFLKNSQHSVPLDFMVSLSG